MTPLTLEVGDGRDKRGGEAGKSIRMVLQTKHDSEKGENRTCSVTSVTAGALHVIKLLGRLVEVAWHRGTARTKIEILADIVCV